MVSYSPSSIVGCLLLVVSFSSLLPSSVVVVSATRPRPKILRRTNPSYTPLSDASLLEITSSLGSSAVASASANSIIDFNDPSSILARILVPRTAGSDALINIQAMVVEHFTKLKWHVERDKFEASTPYGPRTFTNLIFTHDPLANRRLVLSAHLDSKYFPPGSPLVGFVGATDSAAPCAMMMDVAESLTPWLEKRRLRVEKAGGEEGRPTQGETLQIIFFDGEEAFKDWTDTDSIYGARHLAELWSKPSVPPTATNSIPTTPISRISQLILLDLLGASMPGIQSFYPNTGWLYDEFIQAEQRLGSAGVLWENIKGEDYDTNKLKVGVNEKSFFMSREMTRGHPIGGGIGDDHLPFSARGVNVVHLITYSFGRYWHQLSDDASVLHLPTIRAWCMILRVTLAEYLGLEPTIGDTVASGDSVKVRRRSLSEEELTSRQMCAVD